MKNGHRAEKMVMRLALRLLATVVVALAIATPAPAILDGKPDSSHRFVGILVTDIDGQGVPVCSGFLATSTTFVTSAHCIADLGSRPAYVSFARRFKQSSPVVHGAPVQNPDFEGSMEGDTHDLALVVLDDPVTGVDLPELPSAGFLNHVRKKPDLTLLGYGATGFTREDGELVPVFKLIRSIAETKMMKLARKAPNVVMQNGICFGDSGGPVLFDDSDVVVAVNSFVNGKRCNGKGFAYRLDTAESLAFLAPYL
jgi:hypothetical protein